MAVIQLDKTAGWALALGQKRAVALRRIVMNQLKSRLITGVAGMVLNFMNALAKEAEENPVDVNMVEWLSSDAGRKAINLAAHSAWRELSTRYGNDGSIHGPATADIFEQENPYLRQIAMGNLPATRGERTFVQVQQMFAGYFSSDFLKFKTDVPGRSRPATGFRVFEQVKGGTLKEILGGSAADIRKLLWSQDQAITWVENHSEFLNPYGWATFLPFFVAAGNGMVGDKEESFVAGVYNHDGKLKATITPLHYSLVWSADGHRRFVLPCK